MTGRRAVAGLVLGLALVGCSADDDPGGRAAAPRRARAFRRRRRPPPPPQNLRHPLPPTPEPGHRAAAVARHPAAAAAPPRLRPGPPDPARAGPAPVHAAGHGRVPPRARLRLGRRDGPRPTSWPGPRGHPGCPSRRDDLAYVRLTFWGFDDQRHTGELLLNRVGRGRRGRGVPDALPTAGSPFEEFRVTPRVRLDAPPTGDGNDTGAFVCRPTTGSTTTSQPARLRPGHRPRPVPEPLHEGRPSSCPSWRRRTSTATRSGRG